MEGLLPVATTQKNGLMPKKEISKVCTVSLKSGDIVDFGFKSGLIFIHSNVSASDALYLFHGGKSEPTILVEGSAFNDSNLKLYKDSETGTVKIQNNRTAEYTIYYQIISNY